MATWLLYSDNTKPQESIYPSSFTKLANTESVTHQVAYFAAIITSDGFIVALDLRDLVGACVCVGWGDRLMV